MLVFNGCHNNENLNYLICIALFSNCFTRIYVFYEEAGIFFYGNYPRL